MGPRICAVQGAASLSRVGTVEISRRAAAIVIATSIPLAVFTLVGAAALAATLHPGLGNVSVIEVGLPLLLGLLVTPFIHEGIHAIAFLILGGRPRFGMTKKGLLSFLYVGCPGRRFSRIPFIAVGLAPLVFGDLVALALLASLPAVGLAVGALSINTAGSVGDLWLCRIVLGQPASRRWEAADGHFIVWDESPGSVGSTSSS
jgi:putative zincin peptidase